MRTGRETGNDKKSSTGQRLCNGSVETRHEQRGQFTTESTKKERPVGGQPGVP